MINLSISGNHILAGTWDSDMLRLSF